MDRSRSPTRRKKEKKNDNERKKRRRSPSGSSSSSTRKKSKKKAHKNRSVKTQSKKQKRTPSSSSSSSPSNDKMKKKSAKKSKKEKKAKLSKKKKLKKMKEDQKRNEQDIQKRLMELAQPLSNFPAIASSSLEIWHGNDDDGDELGPVMTEEQKARLATRRPLTKEEYDARQSVIRRVLDPQTGRTRLVRGEGEIIEEIVSKEKHKDINKQAMRVDGGTFQRTLGLNR
ncbi:ADP-ribosylation factor-like protein 6-interacting protein 4 [Stigmatopora nigra]